MPDDFYIPRPEQAARIADAMTPDPIFGDRAGQFLAAPRRTGKSTFLRRELVPLLAERGFHPIYIDLWKDRAADPGALLADTLSQSLQALATRTEKALGALPFSKIAVGGVTAELDRASAARAATLTDALVARLNPRLAQTNQLDPDDGARAFELLGHRPEKLTEVIRDHALGDAGSAGLRRTVTERADELRARVWQQHESDYGALTPLQRVVLRVLIEDGAEFAPFAARTVTRVSDGAGAPVTKSEIQKSLDALRDKGVVWRPSRGSYALEDQDMREWLLAGDSGPEA